MGLHQGALAGAVLTGCCLLLAVAVAAAPAPADPDPWELAQRSHDRLAEMGDAVCLFLKTERVEDRLLPTQTIELKIRLQPFSVYMRWLGPPFKGREVVYQKGRFDDKVVAYLGELFGFESIFAFAPDAPQVLEGNRHSITEAGVGHIVTRLHDQFRQARSQGTLRARYLGSEVYLDRPTWVIMRVLEDGGFRYWNIDTELLLPIRVTTYNARHQLQETYSFEDLKLNVGLTDDDFDPRVLW